MVRNRLISLLLCCCPLVTISQPVELSSLYSTYPGTGFEEWLAEFEDRVRHPKNLLTATVEDLTFFPWISEPQAHRILHYLRTGMFTGIDQICDYFNFLPEECELFHRVFTFLPIRRNHQVFLRTRWEVDASAPPGSSYERFSGDNIAVVQYADMLLNNLRIGLSHRKDKGELLKYSSLSGYAFLIFPKWKILIGDYGIRLGFGVLSWDGLGFWKSSDVVGTVFRSSFQIRPRRSSFSSLFLRGIAAQLHDSVASNAKLSIIGWLSVRDKSGSIDSNGNISSLNLGEYYRSETEIRGRHSYKEFSSGAAAQISGLQYRIGTAIRYLSYSRSFSSVSRYAITPRSLYSITTYGLWTNARTALGAEFCMQNTGIGTRVNYQFLPESSAKIAVSFRYYPPDFRSPFGANFGQWSPPGNELGFYTGISLRLSRAELYFATDLYQTVSPPPGLYEQLYGSEIRIGVKAPVSQRRLWFEIRNLKASPLAPLSDGANRGSEFQFFSQIETHAAATHSFKFRWTSRMLSTDRKVFDFSTASFAMSFLYQLHPLHLPEVTATSQIIFYRAPSFPLWLWQPSVYRQWSIATLSGAGITTVFLIQWKVPTSDFLFEILWRSQFQQYPAKAISHTLTFQISSRW